MRNSAFSDNTLIDQGLRILYQRVPAGWRLTAKKGTLGADALIIIQAPDGKGALLLVEAKGELSPRQAAELGPRLAKASKEANAVAALLISNYLSELSRKRLRAAGVNYLDLTGNAWITLKSPGLLIETTGSDRNPSPPRRGIRSLKGAKAARIVRALCDRRPPIGVRELARITGSDPGYVSRVLDLLVYEDLIQRGPSGQVAETNWQDLIRRWSRDYSMTRTNRTMTCLSPRGLEPVIDKLRTSDMRYALTGSFAVPPQASVAVSRLLACYADSPRRALSILELRPADIGANVLLIEPFDAVVYCRSRVEDGLVKVALSQCAVDLLTASGRAPAEAEALLEWMSANEDAWRS